MESNEIVRKQIIEIVNNQIKANDPPQTKQTYERLKKLGYNDQDSKKLIGQCVAIEIFEVMKHQKPFDEARYIRNLNKLPNEPF